MEHNNAMYDRIRGCILSSPQGIPEREKKAEGFESNGV